MGARKFLIGFAVPWAAGAGLLLVSCASSPTSPTYPEQLDDSAIEPTNSTSNDDGQWPRHFKSVDRHITVYPPQVEKWSGNQLEQRAVVAVQTPASKATYGQIWITARTSVDPQNKQVTFENVQIPRARFPSDPEMSEKVLGILRQSSGDLLKPVASDQLKANREITQAESKNKEPVLKHSPPRILFETTPTVLILTDGKAALRDSGVDGLLRVQNTRALILRDADSGKYYFALDENRWMEAASLQGPWSLSEDPPSSLNQAKQSALDQKQVDLVKKEELGDEDAVPKVIVSSNPAALLQTRGEPKFQSIDGTHLLYVENTQDQIFLDETSQDYYVLLSGRWYRSGSLKGPWKFVSAKKLPADFAKIPESHRKGSVLASVAGTPQAKESAINNELPQTAKVDRDEATLQVKYDGTARFKPIAGTSLKYAVNSVTPVIKVSSTEFYAVQKGVWFEAQSPDGPWKVATRVPPEIYSIPPSSPLYYVTHVRIYDSTPQYVYVGYTPGYLGSFYSSDGVVVYGTGYYYPPWIGSIWVGAPFTYWWGPWWGWATFPAYPYYPYYPYVVVSTPASNAPNIYQGWSSQAVPSDNTAAFNQAYTGDTSQTPGTSAGSSGAGWGPTQPAPPAVQAPMTAPFMGGGWGGAVPGGGGGPPAGGGGGGAAGQAFQGGGWGAKK